MKLFCTLFLLSFLLTPLELFAAPKVPAPLSINLETEIHNSIVPGDLFADTFFIKNQSEAPVKFRLSQVNNLEDSKLFDVLKAKWRKQDGFQPLHSLRTEWITLSPNALSSLDLQLYFPADCGNEFQNTELKAAFLFEYQILSETADKNSLSSIPVFVSHPMNRATSSIPSTGDTTLDVYAPFLCCVLSSLLFIRQYFKNKKSRSQNL